MEVNRSLLLQQAKFLLIGSICLFSTACTESNQKASILVNELTIADIHRSYEQGNYNAEQLVQAYLDRIAKIDTQINAISTINPKALEEARQLDLEYKQTGKLRPLHGIPVLVKDNFNTLELVTSAGALALQDFVPKSNATMVNQLLAAGAIIIAKTNMAEWAFSPMHTESSTHGTTKNPYNLLHVPAGSSGGTAASVASNLGAIGLGTDTGNSIRGPSSHCALVGFRSTLGLTSRSGIIPLYLRNDVAGPMCRTVEDATKVLEAIAGYDRTDPVTQYSDGKIPKNYTQFLQKDGLKGARIGVLSHLNMHTDPKIEQLFQQAIKDMQKQGAEVISSVVVHNFDTLRQHQWCAEFRKDVEAYLEQYGSDHPVKTLEDIIEAGTNSNFAKSRLNTFLTSSGRSGFPDIPCLDPYTDQRRIAFRQAIESKMDSLRLDALIYPTWNNPPAKLDSFMMGYRGDNNQIIAPHTGQPAFTVPMGYLAGNLPAGLQFLGRMFDEPTLIKLAYSYEQFTKHRKEPGLE